MNHRRDQLPPILPAQKIVFLPPVDFEPSAWPTHLCRQRIYELKFIFLPVRRVSAFQLFAPYARPFPFFLQILLISVKKRYKSTPCFSFQSPSPIRSSTTLHPLIMSDDRSVLLYRETKIRGNSSFYGSVFCSERFRRSRIRLIAFQIQLEIIS